MASEAPSLEQRVTETLDEIEKWENRLERRAQYIRDQLAEATMHLLGKRPERHKASELELEEFDVLLDGLLEEWREAHRLLVELGSSEGTPRYLLHFAWEAGTSAPGPEVLPLLASVLDVPVENLERAAKAAVAQSDGGERGAAS